MMEYREVAVKSHGFLTSSLDWVESGKHFLSSRILFLSLLQVNFTNIICFINTESKINSEMLRRNYCFPFMDLVMMDKVQEINTESTSI
jgi:hypothetical protein